MTIKKGTVLKGKEGWLDATYQGNVGDVHFVVSEVGTAFIFSTKELQENYELPKEQWVPEIGEEYWTIYPAAKDGVNWLIWCDDAGDNARLENGLAFKTREEALEAVKRARGYV